MISILIVCLGGLIMALHIALDKYPELLDLGMFLFICGCLIFIGEVFELRMNGY